MLKVGLTGSIGTGKSTVSNIFKALGAYVIDADKIVHQLLSNENVKKEIANVLGNEIFNQDGEIDRKKVAKIIFNDADKKNKLEKIIHPKVREEINKKIQEIYNKDPDKIVIVEVPLLIETGMYKNYDKVIVVYAPEDIQLKRLIEKGFSKEDALSRIKAQMPIDEKVKYADIVIDNTKDLDFLKRQVEEVYNKLKREAVRS